MPRTKRTKTDDAPMTEQEYLEYQQISHYDAASLRALALWLNTKKRNRALMTAITAESGRNARHLARAVDYFLPHFDDPTFADERTAREYLALFEYAKWKKADAMAMFARFRFTKGVWELRQIKADWDAAKKAAKPAKPKPAQPCATCENVRVLADTWDNAVKYDVGMGELSRSAWSGAVRELRAALNGEAVMP